MIGRGQREGVAAEFLRDVLAGGALGVPKLEAMARTAGLLGEGQRITHAKVFKKAKKSLGIRSVRNGFGDADEWLWRLERQPASPVSKPLAQEKAIRRRSRTASHYIAGCQGNHELGGVLS